MKALIHQGAALLCLLAASLPLRGQSLSVTAPGYEGAKLFDSTAGYTITGMAADGLGNVYYIETDTNFTGNTRLYKRSALNNYASPVELYNLGSVVTGAFVVFASGKLYFGENTSGNIYSINTDGTNVDPLGTLPVNGLGATYSAAFFGGNLFMSYDAGLYDNRVSRFDLVADGSGGLMLANENVIVNADGDYNGVFEYAGGDLYYGASGFNTVEGLYQFSAAEVAGAITSGELLLDVEHEWGATTRQGVGGIAFGDGTDLWESGTFSSNLLLFDRFNGGVSTIGSAAVNSTLSHLDFAASTLFVNVIDYTAGRSAIYTVGVPEPSSALVLLAGSLLFARRRR